MAINEKKSKSAPPQAPKYGRLFLQHLPVVRRQIEERHSYDSIEIDGRRYVLNQKNFDQAEGVLADIDDAERSVRKLVGQLHLPKAWKSNPAIFIAEEVKTQWRLVDEKTPLGSGFDSPLVKFVQSALKEIGIRKARTTISDALTGRKSLSRKSKGKVVTTHSA